MNDHEDFLHNAGALIEAEYPGPHNKELRAQILREMIRLHLPLNKGISIRQLRALHHAAEESLVFKQGRKPARPVWKTSRKGTGYPRR